MFRCPWAKTELYVQYHDTEWGVPVHDDRLLFEFLILEGRGQLHLRFLRRGDRGAHRPVGRDEPGVRRGLPRMLPPQRHPRRG